MRNYTSPPWALKGSGYFLFCRFTKKFIAAHGFLSDFQKESFYNGWGSRHASRQSNFARWPLL